MIIIAFSNKTSKKFAQLVCRKFKHVAPIIPDGRFLIMYQFVRPGYVEKIKLSARDLKILKAHGWQFIYINGIDVPYDFNMRTAYSCVDLAKRAINMHNIFVQTPLALYKRLKQ